MTEKQDPTVTVYYDGACPRCVRERARYEKIAGDDAVCWLDITGKDDILREEGIDPRDALQELHVRDADGRVHREMDAYILLLQRAPLFRPLAWIIALPVIRPVLSALYRWWVQRRLRKDGRL